MSNLITELSSHGIDYSDHVSTIENEEDREDVMGDLPKWENVDLNTFLMEYYGKKYNPKTKQYKWFPLEAKLGDGSWKGTNTIKEDVLTESIAQLTKRELTMFKFFSKDEVDELNRHMHTLLAGGDTIQDAMAEATSLVYEHARQHRWESMRHQHEPAMMKLLNMGGLGYTPKHLFTMCKEALKENKTRDEYIAQVKATLQLKQLYGSPWKFLNSMYWNTKYWLNEEPSEVVLQCAKRYAHAINWDIQVNQD